MNVYIVTGEPTDGTYMYTYVDSVVVVASSGDTAKDFAVGTLLGARSKFTVQLVNTSDEGIAHENYTQDY